MISRRLFGKLGISAAAVAKVSPFLLFSGSDAQGQSATGEGRDIRRVGVRGNGSYWGHGNEKIDLLSGNLCYAFTLVGAASRNCGAPVRLSYNSQLWKQGLAGPKSYGLDSGVGFGWRLGIASIVPVMNGSVPISFTFVDGTGAEYRMLQNGSVWNSLHGHYITWDPTKSVLWFADGSSMTFGCVAGAQEADAGTFYPTLIQDTNGNQILFAYLPGIGKVSSNSSGRISQIQDARAGFAGNNQYSYLFMYSSDPLPRLLSIINTVGSTEKYSFSYVQQSVSSPFQQDGSGGGSTTLLSSVTGGTGLQHSFQYNGYGELIQAQEPLGGLLNWSYGTFAFQDGRSIREVSSRILSDPFSPTNSHTHTFSRDPSDGGGAIHSSAIVNGPASTAQKKWTFLSDSNSPYLGHASSVATLSGGVVARHRSIQWSSTDTGIPYIANHSVTLDPGASSQQVAGHQLSRDSFGNISSHSHFDYDSGTTPARVITHTHLTDQAYVGRHILNRRTTTTVKGKGEAAQQLHSMQYDTTPLIDRPGLTQHDSANFGGGNTTRGNVTESYVGGVYRRVQHDITGKASIIQDSTNGQVAIVPADGSNNVHIGTIIPNGNQSLGMQIAYSGGKPASVTRPNGDQTNHTYDNFGRVASSAYSNGRVVSYGYSDGPTTVTNTLNGRWRTSTHDGFGNVIKTEVGDISGSHSTVLYGYGPAAGAPMGRLVRKSLPHATGTTPQWVNVAYDDLGRKISQDSASTGVATTFSYSGNSVKATDPAGRWKKIVRDATGKISKVVVQDSTGLAHLESQYSYNSLGKLTSVSMPRANGTQTRSFAYDSGGRIVKNKHAESGLKTSVYNSDGTLASLTDAKAQKHVYTYDAYKRITSIVRLNAAGAKQANDSYSYYHDANPFDPAFSQNAQGRVAAVQWGNASSLPGLLTEMYSYTVSGQLTAKRLRVKRGSSQADLELHISYDGEGRVATVNYPFGDPSLTYSYDSMGRLIGVATNSDSIVKDVAYDSLGHLTSMSLLSTAEGKYLTQGYQYNTRNRLSRLIAAPTDQTTADGTLPSVDLQYAYRPDDGRLLAETDNVAGRAVSYEYDNQGRIASAARSDASWGLAYKYDGFGNRVSQAVTQGTGYAFDEQFDPETNWLLDPGVAYDANGNLIRLPQMQMHYDALNRLARLDGASGTERYGYSDKNLRIWKQAVDGSESVSFYQGTTKLASYDLLTDAHGNLSFSANKVDIYFGDRLVQTGGEVVVVDRLGGTRAWSAKKGAKKADYMPFGEKTPGSTADRSKFGGYERDDASGLDYAEQRYYSSTLGRFMSPDPYDKSARGSSPDSWNRYAFVSNDPINLTDPHGLDEYNGANDDGTYNTHNDDMNWINQFSAGYRYIGGQWVPPNSGGGGGGGGGGGEGPTFQNGQTSTQYTAIDSDGNTEVVTMTLIIPDSSDPTDESWAQHFITVGNEGMASGAILAGLGTAFDLTVVGAILGVPADVAGVLLATAGGIVFFIGVIGGGTP